MLSPILLRLIACLLWCFVTVTAAADEATRELRVLTYNIHHGEGVDAKLDLERIAKVILAEKPDIVALQEVDQKTTRTEGIDQPARLSELTGMRVSFGKAMDYQGGGYGVAILSKWPILDAKTDPLPAETGTEPRVVHSSRIGLGETGPQIRFLVTHVDHRADPSKRSAQVKRIMELFPPAKGELPMLLAGDLNATPDSEVMKMLLTEWTDSAAGQSFFTIPVEAPKRRIDYVLYRPAAAWKVKEIRALEETVASDHRPVLAVLEIIGATAK